MSQQPPPPGRPQPPDTEPEEEALSSTLVGGLGDLAASLGGLNTAIILGGIVGLVMGLVLIIFVPDLRLYGYILLGTGAALLLVSMIISFRTVSTAVTGRRGRYTANTVVMVVAFVGIAAVANFLAFENPKRMDLTATGKFSLAPRTAEIIKDLETSVEAKAFFGPASSEEEQAFRDQVDSMLHEFDVRSSRFSYDFIDPDADPETAREHNLRVYGSVVFRDTATGLMHQVPPTRFLEQDFVTSLLIVSGRERKQVYFVIGHGERGIGSFDNPDGFGLAGQGITAENYAVSPIDLGRPEGKELLEKDRQDQKASMLVVAGPRADLREGEGTILHDYLKGGGNMLFLLEPDTPQSFRDFLAQWGIIVGDGHLVDQQRNRNLNHIIALHPDQYFSDTRDPAFDSLLQTSKLTRGLGVSFYPGATSLQPADGVFFFPTPPEEGEEPKGTVVGTALGRTSGESWLIEEQGRNDPEEGDTKGVFYPAIAVRAVAPLDGEPPPGVEVPKLASIVVFGDSDFASNRYFADASSNKDIFLNSVNWLVGDTALISIRPKLIDPRELVLTRNEFNFMRYSSWFLLPGFMALVGGLVWWRRR